MEAREFEQLVDAHYADLYRFALSLAKNVDDACDLTQQAFSVFAQKGDDVRDPGKRKSWLFTTLYREFLRQGSRAKKVVSMEEADLEQCAAPVAGGGSRAAEQAEMLDVLASLEESHRTILTLFYLDDVSYKDIAAILDLPIGTVMSRLSRAKAALRERMKTENGINPGT
jgi:RNA polymerase sigma-70 factor (ECF subfamily)